MTKRIFIPEQKPELLNMIKKSHERCKASGLAADADRLPEITKEMQKQCAAHVSDFTRTVYKFSMLYYERLTVALESAKSVIYYIADNYDVCGRYGNQKLKDELKSINLCFGANLSEANIGTNAVSLARLGQEGVWCTGKQNYLKALQVYAFFCFTVPSKIKEFKDFVYVLLVTRLEDLTDETLDLFRFIESTEAVHSSGVLAEISAIRKGSDGVSEPVCHPAQDGKKTVFDNGTSYTFQSLIGECENFKALKSYAAKIAATGCTVFIEGESGTGKELFAQSIHNASDRRNKPFISINCGAIPKDLINSELFGYVGGAFTGANKNGAKGKFELANGGTIFLDEIAELPIDVQCVLLRVLEERKVTRIGGSTEIPIDVRIIAATNQDIDKYIKENKFRLDLYYRLNIISLKTIALRDRKEDIDILLDFFVARFSGLYNKQIKAVTQEARSMLKLYDWPGNVREMRNMVERGVITSSGETIELHDLLPEFTSVQSLMEREKKIVKLENKELDYSSQRREIAKQLMLEFKGNKSKVAKEMGIARTTLYRILEE